MLPRNFPNPLSSFIGRERERAEIVDLLSKSRFVTLTGIGGCGKTRLAIETCRDVVARKLCADGIYWLAFESVTDEMSVVRVISNALHVGEQRDRDLLDTLIDYLRPKQLLLAMDNCEHIIEVCAQYIQTLLAACPLLRVLATSREAFNLEGELVWVVEPLSLPSLTEMDISILFKSDAVRLFVERASSVLPSFQLTAATAPVVARVCRQLEGMPLAIELAVARMKIMRVEQIAQHLNEALPLLTHGKRTAPARHRTLRASIEWSYALLNDEERAVFRRLSVFADGASFEAVQSVIGFASLDLLTRLVEKSLLVRREAQSNVRYAMLDTIRQYAREQLRAANEETQTCTAHLDFFMRFAEEAAPGLQGAEQRVWLARIESEYANLTTAMAWCRSSLAQENEFAHVTARTWLRLAAALWFFCVLCNRLSEGRTWLEEAIVHTRPWAKVLQEVWAIALARAGALAWLQGYFATARSRLEESIAFWQMQPDASTGDTSLLRTRQRELAFSLMMLGLTISAHGEHSRAYELAKEAVALFRLTDDRWGLALALASLGQILVSSGNYVEAREAFTESRALNQRLRDQWGLALSTHQLGWLAFQQGDYTTAEPLLQEALAMHRDLDEQWHVAGGELFLGHIARLRGDDTSAHVHYQQSLIAFQTVGHLRSANMIKLHLGYLALRGGQMSEGLAHFEESLRFFYEHTIQDGIAASIEGLACVLAAQDNSGEAAHLFGAAEALREANLSARPVVNQPDYEKCVMMTRTRMGMGAFEAAWAEGRSLPFDQAVNRAQAIYIAQPTRASYPAGLSAREVEVLRLIAQGLSDAQVAEKLVLSRRTINAHLRSIYRKLDVNSRAAASRYAHEHHLA